MAKLTLKDKIKFEGLKRDIRSEGKAVQDIRTATDTKIAKLKNMSPEEKKSVMDFIFGKSEVNPLSEK